MLRGRPSFTLMIISIVRGGRGLKNDDKYCHVPARRGLKRTARAATRHGARDPLFLVPPGNMLITIGRGGGGGQRVMIEIIISVNDENDGQPLKLNELSRNSWE